MSTSDQDRADFVEYVHARQQGLLRFAYLLSGDHHTAEDLVQTALAKTYLTWHRLRDRGAVDSYVRRIIVNEHSGLWRRAWKRNERPTGSVPEVATATESPTVDETMWAAIQRLPKRQRAAVVLRYYEDLSEAETARVLDCSIGNVKSQTSRGLAALRTSLASDRDLLGGGS